MAGFSVASNDHLIRSTLYSNEVKEIFMDELMGTRYVRFITDLPDGDTLNIPSIGQASALDYVEGEAVKYSAMDTGNFQFSIDQYKQSGTYITNKMQQDSWKAAELMSRFVPSQARAIAVAMESKVLAVGPDNQTSADTNTINDGRHRFIGSGTSEQITIEDFHKARYALKKASCPMTNLIAIVDPTVEYMLSTQANVVNLMSPNPIWAPIVNQGMSTGMQFRFSIAGFDIYTSQFLKVNTASETIDSVTAAAGVNNLFFSAAAQPFIGLIRQAPRVDSEYNKDLQRTEYVTTCRYGFDLYRPEALVVVVTDTDQVYA